MLLTQHTSGAVWGYGLFIFETIIALLVIGLVGFCVVRFSQQRLGRVVGGRRMRVVERLSLDHRRSVHLIEVDGKSYLIGTSDQSVHLLLSLDTNMETMKTHSNVTKEAS